VGQDVAFDAVVEEECAGQDIGAVEAGDGQRDDVVKGCCGADVDERQGCGKSADYGD
jgi:hypothetical protein